MVRVDAILYKSPDPLTLCRFYQSAFDLSEPKWFGTEHVGVNAENIYLGFDKAPELVQTEPRVTVWFKVADVDAYFKKLLELGAKKKKSPDKECSPGETLAELFDPEGNVVGLIGP